MILTNVKEIQIPQGRVKQIKDPQGNVLWSIVPKQYQQLQYLEATGTQYIDTGFLVTPETQYIMRIMPTTGTWFGGFTKGANGRWGISYSSSTGVTTLYSYKASCQTEIPLNEISNILIDFGLGITYNGATVELSGSHNLSSDSSGWLFKAQGSSADSGGKIYAFTLIQNGAKVQDLVPCRRIADSVLGMYDLVTGGFLTNAGTGTFVAGNTI